MEFGHVFVTVECPRVNHGTGTVMLKYIGNGEGKFIGEAGCRQYKDGNNICQRCILFLHSYVSNYGVPEKGKLIKPDLSKYL